MEQVKGGASTMFGVAWEGDAELGIQLQKWRRQFNCDYHMKCIINYWKFAFGIWDNLRARVHKSEARCSSVYETQRDREVHAGGHWNLGLIQNIGLWMHGLWARETASRKMSSNVGLAVTLGSREILYALNGLQFTRRDDESTEVSTRRCYRTTPA
ncbi:hypothetical protein BDN70DRAFT_901385 [Pholiota conissans]|uniref:Uncharacterized protein n=1 Tax=Pholiota conissans TaxID=109636 RepID=A0A9P5YML8_9AGAR|nr:hypothetical protein BDN70DRAFT_901385 [Pholiota conissans]